MEISSKYSSAEVEEKWYTFWEEHKYFASKPDEREAYSIVIPPPNVTGVLHMGHMLNNTIQDVLIRKARLDGKNACWVPGTDHASIATEAKVVGKLREEGIKKSDLTRDEFMKHAWDWTDQYGGIILKQLKKLGASPDWDRTSFTMDDVRYKSVIKAFVDLYNKGKLYRGNRMVNWDPVAQTVLSNEEVLHKEETGKLYSVKYKIVGEDKYITIATTRPETILGDSAIAVHPEDERYEAYRGKKAIVPLVNREIPIIFDSYVEKDFGTGALKVTPAHDPNDYELGKTHSLEVIDVLNDNGSISKDGLLYVGEDRFKARKLILKDLEDIEAIVGVEDLVHNVGRSERTNAVVEPKLSLQWYVDMKSLVKPALDAVENGDIKFYPEKYVNTYRHWMTNIRDWCISRQLWWGQRIPAYYYGEKVFVAETKEAAYQQALVDFPELKIEDLKQEDDVLDTWFSSWLWPISVFDGFESQEELDYYYPTSVLVTGWDIIFLWVARMIIAGYEWKGQLPFKDVYFTGMVRDGKRRKMSKSLGNSPDALKLIEDYGADGVRFGMLSCSPAGGDLLFDTKLVENGKKFSNKIWNAMKLIKEFSVDESLPYPKGNEQAYDWISNELNRVVAELESNYNSYRISEGLMSLYTFVWTDFCSWYLEMIKPEYGKPIDIKSYENSIAIFEKICLVLHPFMPFITEEVYHTLNKRNDDDNCINGVYPSTNENIELGLLNDVSLVKEIISNIRDLKNKNIIKPKELIDITIIENDEIDKIVERKGLIDLIKKLAFVGEINFAKDEKDVDGLAFICGKSKLFAHLNLEIDTEKELAKALEDLKYEEGFVNGVQKKLSNERFVNNAPAAVVEKEKKKLEDGLARIEALKKTIASLS